MSKSCCSKEIDGSSSTNTEEKENGEINTVNNLPLDISNEGAFLFKDKAGSVLNFRGLNDSTNIKWSLTGSGDGVRATPSGLVFSSDIRLTNPRDPNPHAIEHELGGLDEINLRSLRSYVSNEHVDHSTVSILSSNNGLTVTNPTIVNDVTLGLQYGDTADTVCEGNDSRITTSYTTYNSPGVSGLDLTMGKVGNNLRFKKLIIGGELSAVDNIDNVTISSSGESNFLNDSGTNASIILNKVGSALNIRQFQGAGGVSIIEEPTSLLISSFDTREPNSLSAPLYCSNITTDEKSQTNLCNNQFVLNGPARVLSVNTDSQNHQLLGGNINEFTIAKTSGGLNVLSVDVRTGLERVSLSGKTSLIDPEAGNGKTLMSSLTGEVKHRIWPMADVYNLTPGTTTQTAFGPVLIPGGNGVLNPDSIGSWALYTVGSTIGLQYTGIYNIFAQISAAFTIDGGGSGGQTFGFSLFKNGNIIDGSIVLHAVNNNLNIALLKTQCLTSLVTNDIITLNLIANNSGIVTERINLSAMGIPMN